MTGTRENAPTRQPAVADILRRVRRIQIVANRSVDDLFAGQYRSVFRGRGMEFEEVRPYQPGDDVRAIDWNVTARAGDPYIKRHCEERELTVMFLIDVSASQAFGSTMRPKLDLVVEIAALLMFSALKNNDKVGLITFCDRVVEHLPPRKGKSHVLRTIRTLVTAPPLARTTRLTSALEFLNRVQKRRAVVFLISDFLAEDAARVLAVTNQRHDLTAIHVSDPREWQIPDIGLACFRDAETGELVEVDLQDRKVRRQLEDQAAARREQLSRQFRRLGIDELAIDTQTDYTQSLRRFFQMRQQRFR